MDKRKLRVLNVLCVGTLVSCLSMTLAVFAATQQSVNMGSSVSFKATAVNAVVSVMATDNKDDKSADDILTAAVATAHNTPLGDMKFNCYNDDTTTRISFEASEPQTTKVTSLALTLADADKDMFILADKTFTIIYTIEKTGGGDIYYYIKLANPDTTRFNTVQYSIDGGTTFENYNNTTTGVTSASAITESSPTLSITFKYTIKSDICAAVSDAPIGKYTIYLANSVDNLTALMENDDS